MGEKLLIDTNILIGLEDSKEIDEGFSELLQRCQLNSVQIFVHEASRSDINRDNDLNRKAVITSKIAKFPELNGIPIPNEEALEDVYGEIKNPNDYVDVILLYTLHEVGAVDFLITQDRGLHKRALRLGIANRVFTVEDALVWLRNKYDSLSVELPFIEEKQCHQINRRDDIFLSLQEDYDGFGEWFDKSCARNHRPCWTINFNNEIAGIAIRKDETFADMIDAVSSATEAFSQTPQKILKVCTFKIKEKYRGEKLGEQLLKQILWWAHKNSYDLVYLTVYPKHKSLVDLLLQYGFENIGRAGGELYLAKSFGANLLKTIPCTDPLGYHRQYYPAFLSGKNIRKFLVPIHSDYYATLFPENVNRHQAELFAHTGGISGNKIAGNTIRKVYVSHAQTNSVRIGDVLLFFLLKDIGSLDSQSLVTVGIVDGFDITSRNDELLRLTAKRSVFSQSELEGFTNGETKKVKVINFLLAGHISPPISYEEMEGVGILGPYQSIRLIDNEQFIELEPRIHMNV